MNAFNAPVDLSILKTMNFITRWGFLPCLSVLFWQFSFLWQKIKSEAYRNWKDATEDLKQHVVSEYYLSSMARIIAFIYTYQEPSKRVDASLDTCTAERIKQNRKILSSITKWLIFCGCLVISFWWSQRRWFGIISRL